MAACRFGLASCTILAVAVVALIVLAFAPQASAAPLHQGTLEVGEQWCDFKLNYDGDDEGDKTFDPDGDVVLPQETGVLGECNFALSSPFRVTVQFESELDDWLADVRVTEEPSDAPLLRETLRVGNREIEVPAGEMVVHVDTIRGETPRASERRSLPQNYNHDLQVLLEFRLLEITLITGSGDRERAISHDVQAASNAYIEAAEDIQTMDTSLEALALANDLLLEGYPGIAERVAAMPPPSLERDGVSIWMWLFIALLALVLVAIAIMVMVALRSKNSRDLDFDPPPSR